MWFLLGMPKEYIQLTIWALKGNPNVQNRAYEPSRRFRIPAITYNPKSEATAMQAAVEHATTRMAKLQSSNSGLMV